MADPVRQWVVTVTLPGRYCNLQLYTVGASQDDARSNVGTELATLKEYVPAADLEITNVEELDAESA